MKKSFAPLAVLKGSNPGEVSIDKIIRRPDKDQNRADDLDEEHITDLMSDIDSNGLKDPITVEPATDDNGEPTGYYYIVDGHHRYQAIKRLRKQTKRSPSDSTKWATVKVWFRRFGSRGDKLTYAFVANTHPGKSHKKHTLKDAILTLMDIAKEGYFGKVISNPDGTFHPLKLGEWRKNLQDWVGENMGKQTIFTRTNRADAISEVMENFGIKDPDKVSVPDSDDIFALVQSHVPEWDGSALSGDLSRNKKCLVYYMSDSLFGDAYGRILQKLTSEKGLGEGPWDPKSIPEIVVIYAAKKAANKSDLISLQTSQKKAIKTCDKINRLHTNGIAAFRVSKLLIYPQKRNGRAKIHKF
jgi:hypothetical protein